MGLYWVGRDRMCMVWDGWMAYICCEHTKLPKMRLHLLLRCHRVGWGKAGCGRLRWDEMRRDGRHFCIPSVNRSKNSPRIRTAVFFVCFCIVLFC